MIETSFTAAELETFACLNNGTLMELSTEHITACTPNPLQCGGSGGCGGSIEPLNYLARRNTTAQWRNRFGLFSSWNHGPPDQPSDEAIESARRGLRYGDDQGAALPVPLEVLERGLVYLRASVYPGHFDSIEHQAERISNGLPAVETDREAQLDEMVESMRQVVAWVYGST